MTDFPDIKMLLVQARTSPVILDQERQCFIERCRIAPEQIVPWNLPERPIPSGAFEAYDVMMIGGAGEFSATETYPWTQSLLDLICEAADTSFPVFGSCWGHQMIARALGGDVRYDRQRTEIGCLWVELNDAGVQDELFFRFPRRFKANMGHHDRVVALPDSAQELAFSDSQGNQAFRIRDRPIYGTQFHSELDAHRERERLYAYRAHYPEVESEEEFQQIIDGLAETTEVDTLLHHFLGTYVAASRP